MPYIIEKDRDALDAGSRGVKTVGELNYRLTGLLQEYMDQNGGRNYTNINAVVGALECAKLECYRRVAVPYEIGKIRQNGDVYRPAYVTEVVPWQGNNTTIRVPYPAVKSAPQQQQSAPGWKTIPGKHKSGCCDVLCLGCGYVRMVGPDRNDPIIMPKDPVDQGFSDVGGLEDHGDDEIRAGMPIDPHMAAVVGPNDGCDSEEHF